jgi:hypothetical protein
VGKLKEGAADTELQRRLQPRHSAVETTHATAQALSKAAAAASRKRSTAASPVAKKWQVVAAAAVRQTKLRERAFASAYITVTPD